MNHKEPTEHSGLSERAGELLCRQEGIGLDFKESVNALSAEDLVAFANTEHGGVVLLGVRELRDSRGMQLAEIVGCEVGDKAKLNILGKAESCVPPVEVRVILENRDGEKPFLRVEIPPGRNRPYCTSGGTYKVRGDARNEALTPDKLLALFLETENSRFVNRFREAASDLEDSILEVKKKLVDEMGDIYRQVDSLRASLEKSASNSGIDKL
ncbi:MAG: ATP-binding protein [Candidatus Fermentibacteraceae bacterium]